MARLGSVTVRALGALVVFGIAQASSCVIPDEDVQSIFTVPASLDELMGPTFYDQPFPSDLRLENGKVRFLGFPNPKNVLIIDTYTQYINDKLDGFSPVGAGYVRFTGSVDPSTLPATPDDSLSVGSSAQLIDVTPTSPERGQRMPITVHWQDEAGVYWPEHTLAFMPAIGHPLRPHTTYAFVVTDGLLAKSGLPVHASDDVLEVLGSKDPTSPARKAARDQLAPQVAEMNAQNIDLKRVAHFTIFTTDDPTAEYLAAAKAMPTAVPIPTADDTMWKLQKQNLDYDEYTGVYGPSPNYQDGKIPFASFGDGGGFKLDDSGVPVVINTFDLRFSLSVPNATACPVPSSGYPIVLYAHGTGGDYRTYVSDGTAKSLAKQCLASMGVDQIFHGTRPGAPGTEQEEEILFFNFNNVEAIRTNVRQSGLDEIQRERLFTDAHLTVPATISTTGMAISFDASKLMFFGHSQGSLNGPLFLAASPAARGGVLSGASAILGIALLEKTQPDPSVANLVKTVFLGLSDSEAAELSLFHPAISFTQSIADTVDPINYARAIIREPVASGPKSIYQTEGIRADGTGDDFAPPRGCEAFAISLGLELQDPFIIAPQDAMMNDLKPVMVPAGGLSGNVAMGNATGLLAQWDPGTGEGHFVVFNVPQATNQAAGFLKNLSENPKGLVPPP
jgi:hypothetical protein